MTSKKKNRAARYGARPTDRPRILVLEGLSGAAECIREAGGEAFSVSPRNVEEVDRAFRYGLFNGLLLTGGGDVDPRLYDEKPVAQVYGVSETRDRVEMEALRLARKHGWPVLGICRGAQIMAVEAGGALRQHIEHHRSCRHLVTADAGSTFRRAAQHNAMFVVSLHHQEVRDPGWGMVISGRSPHGIVEAIESRDGRCLGVQFHPEMAEYQPYARQLFRWLVTESAARAGLATPSWPQIPVAASELNLLRREMKRAAKTAPKPRARKRGKAQLSFPIEVTSTPRRGDSTVRTSWICPKCAIRFDDLADREDHVKIVHAEKPRAALTK